MAVDPAGNIVVAGWFMGSVSFGGATLTTQFVDMFVFKLDPNGNHLWSASFGAPADQAAPIPYALAVDGSGNIVLVGDVTGAVDFGGGPLPQYGSNDIFVVKLDPNGGHVFSHSYGSASGDTAMSVATDASGNVLFTGWHLGTVNFGGANLSFGGAANLYLVKLDAAGNHVWSKGFGNVTFNPLLGVNAAADVYVAAGFSGPTDFGGGPLTASAAGSGNPDVLTAKVDATGGYLWASRYGDSVTQKPFALAVDPSGDVVISGSFDGVIDFGGGVLPDVAAPSMFLVKFSATGLHLWSHGFGLPNKTIGDHALAIDPAGDVLLAGGYSGTLNFGGGPIVAAGGTDISLARFDPSGTLVWQRSLGGPSQEYATGIAISPDGSPIITGQYAGSPDLGDGPLPNGAYDVFVARILP